MRREAERGESRKGHFHRQTDDVGVRSVDPLDNFLPVSLRGVSPRLVQRIYFREVIFDFAIRQVAKLDPGDSAKTSRLAARQMAKANRGPDLMRAAAQEPQHSGGIFEVHRFSEHPVVDRNESIGAEHDVAPGKVRATDEALRVALQNSQFPDGEPVVNETSSTGRRNDLKLIAGFLE